MTIDQRLSRRMYEMTKRSRFLRPIAMFGSTQLLFVMITAVALTSGGSPPETPMMDRFAASILPLGVPLLITWGLSFAMQKLIRRHRPFETDRGKPLIAMVWEAPSFPSAHSSLAVSTATVGWILAGDLYGPWLFLGALIVALSRVAVGVHYLSDVFVGAFVGAVVSLTSLTAMIVLFVSAGILD